MNDHPPASPIGTTRYGAQTTPPDADFDNRWVAWVARGRAHDQRVRRALLVWAGILTAAASIVYLLTRG
ncbi:MAG TPA: hypothetical protein VG871_06605 [Vicinamibacterales bacterium]|nr:hypothetical protein [Vicinamibacterales bacterium]